jgi:hypothetical protein
MFVEGDHHLVRGCPPGSRRRALLGAQQLGHLGVALF